QIRLRLIENHEQLTRIARELVARTLDHDEFLVQAAVFTRDHPEISNLIWLNDARKPVASYSGTSFPPETGISGIETPASLPAEKRPSIVFELPVAPANNGLVLRGQGYRTSIGLIGNGLFWMVMLLSALTVWMLLGTWRHMGRRLQMQAALISETNFRRAMENS